MYMYKTLENIYKITVQRGLFETVGHSGKNFLSTQNSVTHRSSVPGKYFIHTLYYKDEILYNIKTYKMKRSSQFAKRRIYRTVN